MACGCRGLCPSSSGVISTGERLSITPANTDTRGVHNTPQLCAASLSLHCHIVTFTNIIRCAMLFYFLFKIIKHVFL